MLIGVDCASDPKNVGLAAADFTGGRARVRSAVVGVADPAAHVARWIAESDEPALLALDAPLGWPASLAEQLAAHAAGRPIAATAHQMFRRRTDDVVHVRTGKRPLDIGADRIARCTHAALALLERVRTLTGQAVPVAWEPGAITQTSAIEVYPAATLASRRHHSTGYKRAKDPTARATRRRLTDAVARELDLSRAVRVEMARVDHVFDAVVCILAAADFMRGDVIVPRRDATVVREGWIWVRPPPTPAEP